MGTNAHQEMLVIIVKLATLFSTVLGMENSDRPSLHHHHVFHITQLYQDLPRRVLPPKVHSAITHFPNNASRANATATSPYRFFSVSSLCSFIISDTDDRNGCVPTCMSSELAGDSRDIHVGGVVEKSASLVDDEGCFTFSKKLIIFSGCIILALSVVW